MARGSAYTPEQLAWLAKEFQVLTVRDLTPAFNNHFAENRTCKAIESCLKKNGITCARKGKSGRLRLITPEQAEWLKVKYKTLTQPELTAAFNKHFGTDLKFTQIRAFLKNHKIRCSRTGQFEKGHAPANKGTKGMMKANSGTFRPGNMPGNTNPLWHERICTKDGYILMKVPRPNPYTGAATRYLAKHVWLWEEARGPVPDGYLVTFIDGDKMNCALDNLECISRAEHARRNQLRINDQPDELRPTVRALAKLITKTHERGKPNATD